MRVFYRNIEREERRKRRKKKEERRKKKEEEEEPNTQSMPIMCRFPSRYEIYPPSVTSTQKTHRMLPLANTKIANTATNPLPDNRILLFLINIERLV